MKDVFTASIRLQKQLLDAQQASISAGRSAVAMQEMAMQLVEANLAAIDAWAKIWGGGRR